MPDLNAWTNFATMGFQSGVVVLLAQSGSEEPLAHFPKLLNSLSGPEFFLNFAQGAEELCPLPLAHPHKPA